MQPRHEPTVIHGPPTTTPRLLISAGPTHEPIDAVRYIGNRSSGRVGISLADRAAAAGWGVTLLLGPSPLAPSSPGARVERFRTAAELGDLLARRQAGHDILIMAAAVADYRPVADPERLRTKLRRETRRTVLELEPTEDLLAACSARRSPGQLLVGFALEPRERMMDSAREKLGRKGVDLIVANPLGTMESESIEAHVLGAGGEEHATGGLVSKEEFASWLLKIIERCWRERVGAAGAGVRG